MDNSLIYGKAGIERVVSAEPGDGFLELFIQELDGSISTKHVLSNYWLLSPTPLSPDFVRLQGDLHYKWGIQFTSREEFLEAKNKSRKHDTFSVYNPIEPHLINKGISYFNGMKHQEPTVLSFDIETTGLKHDSSSKLLLISNTFRKLGKIERKLFAYDDFQDEGKMIDSWCAWVRMMDPSIMLGHNIYGFDLKYIDFIARQYNTSLALGRDGSDIKFEPYESKFRKDATQFYHYNKARIYGREIVDTLFLAIKSDVSRKYESYGLKQIIKQEGLEIKGRQFYDASRIRFEYKNSVEWDKIKKYCENDSDDSLAVYDLMIPASFYMAQSVPKCFQEIITSATGSQINSVMCRAYLQDGHSLPKADESSIYEGAISIGNPGVYKNVFKVDVASLYPSIILTYDVYDKYKDPKRKFLELVQTFTTRRLEHKKLAKTDKYYDDLQNAEKIFINSCYGFLGTPGLAFNSPLKAAFITQKGREILTKAINWAKDNEFPLVNADTDSISFTLPKQEIITQQTRANLLENLSTLYPNTIKWEDDGIYLSLVVIKAKNYVMLTEDNKVKYKGSAIRDAKREPAIREFLEKIVQSFLFEKGDIVTIYNEYVKEIIDVKDIKRWSSRKTVTQNVLNGERTNETKILDALEGKEYSEGDKFQFFYLPDDKLCLVEDFKGEYNKETFLKKLFTSAKLFDTIVDVKAVLPNYSLKKNRKLLEENFNECLQ